MNFNLSLAKKHFYTDVPYRLLLDLDLDLLSPKQTGTLNSKYHFDLETPLV